MNNLINIKEKFMKFLETQTKKNNEQQVSVTVECDDLANLEKKVENILSKIQGAGKVNVMISYASGQEKILAYDKKNGLNDTEEKDNNSGSRNIKQDNSESKIAYENLEGGIKKPIIVKEKYSEIRGVVVVAEGADNAIVKQNLSKAVEVL